VSTGLLEYLPLPRNSITSNRINDPLAKDFREVFSFYDFLQNQETRLTPQQYNAAYKNYLNVWSDVKKSSESEKVQLIKDRYVELLKDISLNYLSFEEKRFLKLADFNDPHDLDIILPLYSKKIIDICKYHTEKREKTKHATSKNQERGTKNSIEHVIHDSLTDYVFVGDDNDLNYNFPKLNVDEIIRTLDIEIEELIDVYTTYLDNDPNLGYENYDTKNELRKELFTSNSNDIDGNLFLDFDAATRKYIFDILSIFLKETGRVFSINYDITRVNLNCKSGDKLYDLVTKYKDYAENILELKSELIKKFIGTDFYYIKTGDSINDITTGKLFEAYNPSGNLLNRHFPSTASIEEDSQLITLRKLGLFFRPEKTGLLYFSVPKNNYQIDYSKLEPNKLYIYPDPNRYGNTAGLTNNYYSDYPLIHTQDYTPVIKNVSNGFANGDIFSNPTEQNFFGYIAKNQLANSKVINKKGLELNFLSLSNKGSISRWNSDIFGNQFALFEPTKFKSYTDKRSSLNENLTTYNVYDGGVMLFDDDTQLSVLCSSDKSGWPGFIFSSRYYYNILLEGGIGGIVNGVMIRPITAPRLYDGLLFTTPASDTYTYDICLTASGWTSYDLLIDCGFYTDAISYEASFSFGYILSSIQYKELDGGSIIQDEVYSEFDSTKNILLKELQNDRYTKTTNAISITGKEIYVRNIKDNTVSNIRDSFSDILKKYNYHTSLSSELIYNIEDFNVYTDILYIRTSNYAIFEKYKFDGSFNPANTPSSILSGNLSEPFFFEDKNYSLICTLEISGSNILSSNIIPNFYKINYSNTQIEKIDYVLIDGLSADIFTNPLPVVYTRVSKPILTYNSRNKIYTIASTLFDNNNIPYIYQIFFKFDNITINILNTNLICLMKEKTYKTIDILNDEHDVLFNFNRLNRACKIIKNTSERSLEFYE
jgi:hypothetical protein